MSYVAVGTENGADIEICHEDHRSGQLASAEVMRSRSRRIRNRTILADTPRVAIPGQVAVHLGTSWKWT